MMDEIDRSAFKRLNIFMLILLGVSLLISALSWGYVPDQMIVPEGINLGTPGPDGQVATRAELLLGMSGGMALLTIVFAVIPLIEPRRANLLRSSTAYMYVCGGIGIMVLALHGMLVASQVVADIDMTPPMLIVLGIFTAVIGNFLGKVRSNFMFGLRTPWTLASDLSWNRSHRLAGKVTMAFGVMLPLGLVFLPLDRWISIWATAFGVSILGLVVYSFIVWRADPDKRNWGMKD